MRKSNNDKSDLHRSLLQATEVLKGLKIIIIDHRQVFCSTQLDKQKSIEGDLPRSPLLTTERKSLKKA